MTDREKLAELYRIYEKPLYRIAYAVLHDHSQAEDAVSEAFCRVMRHIGKIGDPASPQTKQYMVKTIRSTSFSQYRYNRRHAERTQVLDEHHAELPDPHDMLHQRIERQSLLETLTSMLGILNETDRQIVVWHGRDGIPFAQIGEHLHLSEAAVRKRYERARKRMKSEIEKGEEP
ncbi:MAG: sigma-70 family RNA polymerase sigma factor [Oscillospiraceae bacterium]|nr:sigma-70 family RNA polymerase sigma factor [Oscillospiraceae bacterium]